MAKSRTVKRKPTRRAAAPKKDNSTLLVLIALAAGVAYLMSKGTINVPAPGVLDQAHQDAATTTAQMLPVTTAPVSNIMAPAVVAPGMEQLTFFDRIQHMFN
jgi:hypothetical protein